MEKYIEHTKGIHTSRFSHPCYALNSTLARSQIISNKVLQDLSWIYFEQKFTKKLSQLEYLQKIIEKKAKSHNYSISLRCDEFKAINLSQDKMLKKTRADLENQRSYVEINIDKLRTAIEKHNSQPKDITPFSQLDLNTLERTLLQMRQQSVSLTKKRKMIINIIVIGWVIGFTSMCAGGMVLIATQNATLHILSILFGLTMIVASTLPSLIFDSKNEHQHDQVRKNIIDITHLIDENKEKQLLLMYQSQHKKIMLLSSKLMEIEKKYEQISQHAYQYLENDNKNNKQSPPQNFNQYPYLLRQQKNKPAYSPADISNEKTRYKI